MIGSRKSLMKLYKYKKSKKVKRTIGRNNEKRRSRRKRGRRVRKRGRRVRKKRRRKCGIF